MPLRLRTQIQAASQNTRNNNNNTEGQGPEEALEEVDFASATEQLQAQLGSQAKRGKGGLFSLLVQTLIQSTVVSDRVMQGFGCLMPQNWLILSVYW